MKTTSLLALGVVALLIGMLVGFKVTQARKPQTSPTIPPPKGAPLAPGVANAADPRQKAAALPKLLELGSTECAQCKEMAPIIDALTAELKGKVEVSFTDVDKDPAVVDQYKIDLIPTQVFLDAEGKELFRHTGVFQREEILAKMNELKMLPR